MLAIAYKNQISVLELALIFKVKQDPKLERLLSQLPPDNPWGEHKDAAKILGYMRSQEAVSHLLAVLPSDPFWMVHYTINQALERIGNPDAIPTLQSVAIKDSFQVVRSSAAQAIKKYRKGNRFRSTQNFIIRLGKEARCFIKPYMKRS